MNNTLKEHWPTVILLGMFIEPLFVNPFLVYRLSQNGTVNRGGGVNGQEA